MKCLNLMKPHVCSRHIKLYVIGANQHAHTNRYSGYIFNSLKKKKSYFQHTARTTTNERSSYHSSNTQEHSMKIFFFILKKN